ncbi:hypothetical protein TrVE_jg1184 [Triparma verrucosa]|uniref:START domain-containing protein n=2 Tax=Triparma TaxID=722752 RepID=A0A9W7E5A3_9STRA|nr:hypothetical protein TrST_g9898 [Triparma strigata]GMH98138.1 hypothetical protein TrVE_jg1184 [Triparma verrucosa]
MPQSQSRPVPDPGILRAEKYHATFDKVWDWAQGIRDPSTSTSNNSNNNNDNTNNNNLEFEEIDTPPNALFRLGWTPQDSPVLHIEVTINTNLEDLIAGCSDTERFKEYNRVFFPIADVLTVDVDTKIVHGKMKSLLPGLSKQRDFVTAVQRRKTSSSLVLLHSAAPPEVLPPMDQYVRAEAVQGAICLDKEDETRTKVTIITHLDLKFSLWMTKKLCPRLAPVFIKFCQSLENIGNSIAQGTSPRTSSEGFCAIGYAVTFPSQHTDDDEEDYDADYDDDDWVGLDQSSSSPSSSYLIMTPSADSTTAMSPDRLILSSRRRIRKRSLAINATKSTFKFAKNIRKKLSLSTSSV